MILRDLGRRLGIDKYFLYQSMEELVAWQLEGAGFSLEDFRAKGFVAYCDAPILWGQRDGIKLKTAAGKIKLVSSLAN